MADKSETSPPPPKRRLTVAQRVRRYYRSVLGGVRTEERDGLRIVKYEKDGVFDYDTYKEIQTLGNQMKLRGQWVREPHIAELAKFVGETVPNAAFGLCHGTRRGNEQTWFRKHLAGAEVIGTEISDTATQFPHTIQWDFHETKPEWLGAAGFVYSNAWDHAFDPERAFRGWASCLAPGGALLLDHSPDHTPQGVNEIDSFGASREALIGMLDTVCAEWGAVETVLEPEVHSGLQCPVVVFRARG